MVILQWFNTVYVIFYLVNVFNYLSSDSNNIYAGVLVTTFIDLQY